MNIKEISKSIDGTFLSTSAEYDIQHISIDSRSAKCIDNELFIALKGPNHNGHQFISKLVEKGIRNFIVEDDIGKIEGVNIIKVSSSLEALQKLAEEKRKAFAGKVIGITGSNGKTIVKEWLSTLLSGQFNVLKSPKSYNSQVGVPLSIWPLEPENDLAIFEAGISKPGEMDSLAKMIKPSIGVFTNIGTAHDEFFNSRQQKVTEKLKLFNACKALIFCADNEELSAQIEANFLGEKISWSLNGNSLYTVQLVDKNKLSINKTDEESIFHTQVIEQASLENLVHSIIAALHLGLTSAEIQKGIDLIRPVKMRLELKKGINNTYLIDDTYNNDIVGLQKALDFMGQQEHLDKKTVILSDFVQNKPEVGFFTELNTLLKQKGISKLIAIGTELELHKDSFTIPSSFFPHTGSFLKSEAVNNFSNELILIKGARKFELERISKILSEKGHKTVLEINLDAITHNLNFYRSLLKSDTKIMVVVKALAYGAGSSEISKILEFHKVDYLAVAYADEGVALRENGVSLPIMVMNASEDDPFSLIQHKLEPEIFSLVQLKSFAQAYKLVGQILPAHLILNTGMNRLGFNTEDLDELLEIIKKESHIEVKSIFTHLAASEEKAQEEFTASQVDTFYAGAKKIEAQLTYKPIRHILNSGGIVRHNHFQENMVRLGIGLHGIEVSGINTDRLQHTATLKTVVSQIRKVKSGETIGYGRKGLAEKDIDIATIAIGYADGYLRHFGNGKAYVLINGQKASTIGNICMDMSMVDITGVDVNVGDEVIVFGDDPSVNQLAEWANTIPYEILTNVSNRVKRVFYAE